MRIFSTLSTKSIVSALGAGAVLWGAMVFLAAFSKLLILAFAGLWSGYLWLTTSHSGVRVMAACIAIGAGCWFVFGNTLLWLALLTLSGVGAHLLKQSPKPAR